MVTAFTNHTSFEGWIRPDQEKTYLHLPFQVPENAVRLAVEYWYSDRISSDPRARGGNTIDLGIFDERGIDYLTGGFRGWSGSDKDNFWITPEAATPGYLAGELNPGQWHILFGLYKIAPQGCSYRVNITITTQAESKPKHSSSKSSILDLPSSLPSSYQAANQVHWLRGELHCHTWHSDGSFSPAELLRLACSRGMNFLAIADHNTTAAQIELEKMIDPGLVLIRGMEVTTFRGHFNVLGIPDWIDFRVQDAGDMRSALQRAADLGAFTSCNHPKPFGPDWDFREETYFNSVEVWNGPWTGFNEISLEYWSQLLASGMRISAVGGSDFHRAGERAGMEDRDIGTPTNWVNISGVPTASKILSALRQGHVVLSENPSGPFIELSDIEGNAQGGDEVQLAKDGRLGVRVRCLGGAGSILRLLDQRGILVEQVIDSGEIIVERVVEMPGSMFIRAELRHPDERLRAMTNPIYIVSC